jgi:hypothetical protein
MYVYASAYFFCMVLVEILAVAAVLAPKKESDSITFAFIWTVVVSYGNTVILEALGGFNRVPYVIVSIFIQVFCLGTSALYYRARRGSSTSVKILMIVVNVLAIGLSTFVIFV